MPTRNPLIEIYKFVSFGVKLDVCLSEAHKEIKYLG
jgi:hypothetical protein